MSLPEFKALAGLYTLRYPDEHITIHLDRLEEHHQVTSAELTITTDLPGVSPHLHQARLNLISTRGRKTITTYLASRLPDLDWDAMLEQACILTLRHHREGEPLIMIGSMPPSEKPRYRVEPILLENQANLIYGAGGIGKSYFAYLLALLVESGVVQLGLTPVQGEVLYLDYETCGEEADEKVRAIKAGMNLPTDCDIHYRFCHQPLVADIAEIQRMVVGIEAGLVIVDSIGVACGGEPESAEIMLAYFRALRSLRVTTLSIDHITKQDKSLFGSVYKYNTARSIYEVKKSQNPGEAELSIGLYHRKVNTGRLQHPQGFILKFGNASVSFNRKDIKEIPELAEGFPLWERIKDLLFSGAMTQENIAMKLDAKPEVIRVTLYKYKNIFVKLNDKWGVLIND